MESELEIGVFLLFDVLLQCFSLFCDLKFKSFNSVGADLLGETLTIAILV